jgi:UvrD-like helicase C-terminal domain
MFRSLLPLTLLTNSQLIQGRTTHSIKSLIGNARRNDRGCESAKYIERRRWRSRGHRWRLLRGSGLLGECNLPPCSLGTLCKSVIKLERKYLVSLLDEEYLILSTIHSAKGQEWNSVFVLNCVDGCLPSDLATESTPEIEEERRLLYVAMTRAKDHLHLIVPQRFHAHQQRNNDDRHMYALRTRFIPDAITDHFEQCAWPAPTRTSSSTAIAPPKTVPIGARLKQMWR